jgi:hypothetical protein
MFIKYTNLIKFYWNYLILNSYVLYIKRIILD